MGTMNGYHEYMAPYAPESCAEDGHVPGCPGKAGGDHEYLITELTMLQCSICEAILDDVEPVCRACGEVIE